jgi:hypothetical protein
MRTRLNVTFHFRVIWHAYTFKCNFPFPMSDYRLSLLFTFGITVSLTRHVGLLRQSIEPPPLLDTI